MRLRTFTAPDNTTELVPLSLVSPPASGTVTYTAASSNSQVTAQVLTNLATWDLTVTGVDANGVESGASNQISLTVP